MKTKKFVYDENLPPLHYRPNTSDESIIQTVLIDKKDYAFPKLAPKVCYDVGANIGVVSVIMANIYPNAKIFAFEPVHENFELLVKNVEYLPNVRPLKYGLGGDTGARRIWHSDNKSNLGGFSTAIKVPGGEFQLVDVRDVAAAFQDFGVPDVLKIDVEGAEAEIFESMPNVDGIKWVTGELHGVREFQVLDLLSKHFDIACARPFGAKVWHFHAVNRALAEGHGLVQNT